MKNYREDSQHLYSYNGPVFLFDRCVDEYWTAETYAVSEKKARSNLTYQYKRENGYLSNSKITLTGKITMLE